MSMYYVFILLMLFLHGSTSQGYLTTWREQCQRFKKVPECFYKKLDLGINQLPKARAINFRPIQTNKGTTMEFDIPHCKGCGYAISYVELGKLQGWPQLKPDATLMAKIEGVTQSQALKDFTSFPISHDWSKLWTTTNQFCDLAKEMQFNMALVDNTMITTPQIIDPCTIKKQLVTYDLTTERAFKLPDGSLLNKVIDRPNEFVLTKSIYLNALYPTHRLTASDGYSLNSQKVTLTRTFKKEAAARGILGIHQHHLTSGRQLLGLSNFNSSLLELKELLVTIHDHVPMNLYMSYELSIKTELLQRNVQVKFVQNSCTIKHADMDLKLTEKGFNSKDKSSIIVDMESVKALRHYKTNVQVDCDIVVTHEGEKGLEGVDVEDGTYTISFYSSVNFEQPSEFVSTTRFNPLFIYYLGNDTDPFGMMFTDPTEFTYFKFKNPEATRLTVQIDTMELAKKYASRIQNLQLCEGSCSEGHTSYILVQDGEVKKLDNLKFELIPGSLVPERLHINADSHSTIAFSLDASTFQSGSRWMIQAHIQYALREGQSLSFEPTSLDQLYLAHTLDFKEPSPALVSPRNVNDEMFKKFRVQEHASKYVYIGAGIVLLGILCCFFCLWCWCCYCCCCRSRRHMLIVAKKPDA